jgi:osmoprotectant transport system substrate-binding protein
MRDRRSPVFQQSPTLIFLVAVLVGCVATAAAAGCGGGPVDKAEVTLKIRPEGSPERRLVTQIYAQALKRAGYRVKAVQPSAFESSSYEDLQKNGISGYAEYMSTILFYEFELEIEDIPTRTPVAYRELEQKLEKQELTAFPPAPYSIANEVGMLRSAARRRGLRTDSQLKGQAEGMTLKAPTYCHVSVECLAGIERHYGTAFEAVSYEQALTPELTWWRAEPKFRYEVLEDGEADASILYNTDGRLATEADRFVVLKDDRHIFPASNFVWITSDEVVGEAGPDYEETIAEAQKGLTLGTVRLLNARLEAGKSPARVAADYLDSISHES